MTWHKVDDQHETNSLHDPRLQPPRSANATVPLEVVKSAQCDDLINEYRNAAQADLMNAV
jgi:hypothetical protein